MQLVVPSLANILLACTQQAAFRTLLVKNNSHVSSLRKVNAPGAAAADTLTARLLRNRNSHAGTFSRRGTARTVLDARSVMKRTAPLRATPAGTMVAAGTTGAGTTKGRTDPHFW
mmetsp:Transcript_30773/g.60484  ORF Transcript_30773/g.60484 Transcript_30773/m.60484 type:complete len:115 (+) Transcript_30773:1992-2336(+)